MMSLNFHTTHLKAPLILQPSDDCCLSLNLLHFGDMSKNESYIDSSWLFTFFILPGLLLLVEVLQKQNWLSS